jgi:uncharacterized protein involved in outer membrane biogenesis
MNSFLLFLAGLLVLAMSTLFAAPYFIDWNDYRDVFEAQASKLIGRKVDVGGDVSLSLLPSPVLRFETINVADAKGNFDTPFASAKSFTVWLSVPPLLRGNIEARSVEIDQPVLNLRIAKDGSGNWADISGEAVDIPFIPKDVALNSVEISGATINFWRGDPEPDSVVEQLDGELSARSLQGPYKFTGQFLLDDKRRDLRFSTTRPEENGEFRLKASLRSPDANETYVIDGGVRGLGAIPVFKGEFSTRLASQTTSSKKENEDKKSEKAAPFEIKSKLFAGFTGAQFSEMELVITRNGKPQTLRGLLDVKFDKGLVVGGTFSSRWVDLDSWVGPNGDGPPKLNEALAGLASEILRRASSVREGSLNLLLDQAVLAGDLATNVQVSLSVADNKLELSKLSARLPGDNRISANGFLTTDEGGVVFKGPVSFSGTTLSRLLRWAGLATQPSAATQPGEFLLKGELTAGPDRLLLEQAEGNLFGSAFNGAFTYRGGDKGEVSVTLKSDRMDLARVLGSSASAKSLWALVGKSGNKKDGKPLGWLGNLRAAADVNIGAISFAGLGESALEAKLTLDKGALDIRQMNLTSSSGVSIQAGGRLTGLGDKPEGNLTLALHADTGAGVASLSEFLDLPTIARSSPERLAAMTPVEVTAAIRSASPDSTGLDVQLEGSLGKSDLQLKLDLKGAPAEWTASNIALQGSLTNASGAQLLQQLRPHLKQDDLVAFSAGAGSISLEASGVANEGLQTKMILKAGGANWIIQGKYQVAAAGSSFSGTTSISTPNTAAGLALIGVRGAPGHGSEPASLEASVESTGGVTRLSDVKGTLGGATYSGEGQVDMSKDRPAFKARIAADAASLPRLLAPIVAWQRGGDNPQEIRGVSKVEGYWPDAPFNTSLFDSTDGTLSLETERLQLTGGLVLEKAKMKAKLSDGTLRVSALEGGLYGGTFTASGELATRGGGMAIDAKASVAGLRLERVTQTSDGGVLVNAPSDLTLTLKGEGLTPRGLAASLSGRGKLVLGAGKINGFSLGAAHAAASSAQRKKSTSGVDEAELGRRVAENLKNSEMSFSTVNAPFTVSNGVLEFEKLALSDADGRVTVASYLQLSTLELDSEWALQAAESTGGARPRVSLVFSGALKDIGKLQPKIDTTGLARYVTIRKMEKDVERLENLDVSGKKPKPKPPSAEKTAQATKPKPKEKAAPPGPVPPLPKRKQTVARPQTPPASAAAPVPAPAAAAAIPQPVRKPPPVAAAMPPAAAAPPPPASAPPVAVEIPQPVKKQPPAAAPPPPPTAPPVAATVPPPASAPPVAAVVPGPATAPPPTAVAPQPAAIPPVAAVAPAPVKLPSLAPLPRRKPPVPPPAPRSTPQAAPALPWLQSVTPPPPPAAPPPPPAAPPPPPAAPGAAQAPTQLPAPVVTSGSPATPPQGQTTPDTAPATPPAQRPSQRFDPFAEETGN